MKGLIRNNLYSASSGYKLMVLLAVLSGVAGIVLENGIFVTCYGIVVLILFPINTFSTVQVDTYANWSKYEISLPVRRRDIILSKYICYILFQVIGIILIQSYLWFFSKVYPNFGVREMLPLFYMGIGLSLGTAAIFYPLIYTLGIDKSELLISVSLIIMCLIMAAATFLLEKIGVEYELSMKVFQGVAIVLLLLSYLITNQIYQKKEY